VAGLDGFLMHSLLPLTLVRQRGSQGLRLLTHPGFPAAGLCSLQPGRNTGCSDAGVSRMHTCVCAQTGILLAGAAAVTNKHAPPSRHPRQG
jgi:hypothetical protein